jgi:hypothetical protein
MAKANIYSDADADRGAIRYHNKIITPSTNDPKSGTIYFADGVRRIKKVGNKWLLIDHW